MSSATSSEFHDGSKRENDQQYPKRSRREKCTVGVIFILSVVCLAIATLAILKENEEDGGTKSQNAPVITSGASVGTAQGVADDGYTYASVENMKQMLSNVHVTLLAQQSMIDDLVRAKDATDEFIKGLMKNISLQQSIIDQQQLFIMKQAEMNHSLNTQRLELRKQNVFIEAVQEVLDFLEATILTMSNTTMYSPGMSLTGKSVSPEGIQRLLSDWSLRSSSVVSVAGFDAIVFIAGNVQVDYNTKLATIGGFSNVTMVAESVEIGNNTQLVSIIGFGKLTRIGGDLQIHDNTNLLQLWGFQNVTSIGGQLRITNNMNLTSFAISEGLQSLRCIQGGVGQCHNCPTRILELPMSCEASEPTFIPTPIPTMPSAVPTRTPSDIPSTITPSALPSVTPSSTPTSEPTGQPIVVFLSDAPTVSQVPPPTASPTVPPTSNPITSPPTKSPTKLPTRYPTTTPLRASAHVGITGDDQYGEYAYKVPYGATVLDIQAFGASGGNTNTGRSDSGGPSRALGGKLHAKMVVPPEMQGKNLIVVIGQGITGSSATRGYGGGGGGYPAGGDCGGGAPGGGYTGLFANANYSTAVNQVGHALFMSGYEDNDNTQVCCAGVTPAENTLAGCSSNCGRGGEHSEVRQSAAVVVAGGGGGKGAKGWDGGVSYGGTGGSFHAQHTSCGGAQACGGRTPDRGISPLGSCGTITANNLCDENDIPGNFGGNNKCYYYANDFWIESLRGKTGSGDAGSRGKNQGIGGKLFGGNAASSNSDPHCSGGGGSGFWGGGGGAQDNGAAGGSSFVFWPSCIASDSSDRNTVGINSDCGSYFTQSSCQDGGCSWEERALIVYDEQVNRGESTGSYTLTASDGSTSSGTKGYHHGGIIITPTYDTIPVPTAAPTTSPSYSPTDLPSNIPTTSPSDTPTTMPTDIPTTMPTDSPSDSPTDVPSNVPSDIPTDVPTDVPSIAPSDIPTDTPSDSPTDMPTDMPTDIPTDAPTDVPTDVPSDAPSNIPTDTPSDTPTDIPTNTPTRPAETCNGIADHETCGSMNCSTSLGYFCPGICIQYCVAIDTGGGDRAPNSNTSTSTSDNDSDKTSDKNEKLTDNIFFLFLVGVLFLIALLSGVAGVVLWKKSNWENPKQRHHARAGHIFANPIYSTSGTVNDTIAATTNTENQVIEDTHSVHKTIVTNSKTSEIPNSNEYLQVTPDGSASSDSAALNSYSHLTTGADDMPATLDSSGNNAKSGKYSHLNNTTSAKASTPLHCVSATTEVTTHSHLDSATGAVGGGIPDDDTEERGATTATSDDRVRNNNLLLDINEESACAEFGLGSKDDNGIEDDGTVSGDPTMLQRVVSEDSDDDEEGLAAFYAEPPTTSVDGFSDTENDKSNVQFGINSSFCPYSDASIDSEFSPDGVDEDSDE